MNADKSKSTKNACDIYLWHALIIIFLGQSHTCFLQDFNHELINSLWNESLAAHWLVTY